MKNPFAVAHKYLDIPQSEPSPPELDDPVLNVEDWYPGFREFHHKAVSETPTFDYCSLRENKPELFKAIKAKENEIDALGAAPLSEVMALMRDWRTLILNAYFEQQHSKKKT